jgi:hypothetical protein
MRASIEQAAPFVGRLATAPPAFESLQPALEVTER